MQKTITQEASTAYRLPEVGFPLKELLAKSFSNKEEIYEHKRQSASVYFYIPDIYFCLEALY